MNIFSIFLGIAAGTISGLLPGIHINLISFFVVSFLSFHPLSLAIFIFSLAITHTFLDFIPGIFLGAPEAETSLAVLPAHKLLKRGLAYRAILLTTIGSLFGLIFCLLLLPLLILIIPYIHPFLKISIPFILIFISILLLSFEKNKKAIPIFFLAGLLGIIVLKLPLKQQLMPLLTGLFGTSLLAVSIIKTPKIPKQKIEKKIKIKIKEIGKGILASLLVSFLPGIGASQAAVISSLKTKNEEDFLLKIGTINTVVMFLSLVALYVIKKTRTGAMVFISSILSLSLKEFLILICCGLIAGGIATILTLYIGKTIAKKIHKINYRKIATIIFLFLILLTLLLSGWVGFLVLICSTSLGIFCQLNGIRKMHLMACLILPTIIFYL